MAENNTILPHDILAEQAVIGSIFVDPDKIPNCFRAPQRKFLQTITWHRLWNHGRFGRQRKNQSTPYQLNQHLTQ